MSEAQGNKFYVGKLVELNGEISYSHDVHFMTSGDPDEYLERVASTFRGSITEKADGGYYFMGGALHVTAGMAREVSREFFEQCCSLGVGVSV